MQTNQESVKHDEYKINKSGKQKPDRHMGIKYIRTYIQTQEKEKQSVIRKDQN